MSLPTGTVTFLFTDIEGSTRLLQELGDAGYGLVLADHRRLLRDAFGTRNGHEVETQGDGFLVAFGSARDAVAAAVAAQRAVGAFSWPNDLPVRVRMGLHTGQPTVTDAGYVGLDLHRTARICGAGHGGQMLISQTTRDLVEDGLPDGVTLRDLGEHRLKDLTRSQRIFQLVVPGLPAEFPPLKSVDILPNNLPVQMTSFVGRDGEIAEVRRLLPTTRLLTLTGTGGCGKTRLALQVVAGLLEEYPDGVWLVELASLADPNLIPQATASVFAIPEQPGRLVLTTLTEALRQRQLLLLLDNCEHLLAACAQMTETLLHACENMRILATSREPLRISGEVVYHVPSLPVPSGSLGSIERLMEVDAVRLFLDRAASARPGFRLTERNATVVADICQRLDGIPLALELAASRVMALSPEQIAERLNDRFRLLTGGSRTALPRRQTLRAAMDWSYDLLSEAERVLFRRLSVFAGGFDLEAAEKVCAGDGLEGIDILDLLAYLVDKSLIMVQETEHRPGHARYWQLETTREYGREKLQTAGDETTVRTRHRDWFVELAERARQHRWTRTQTAWLDRLETENDNLRAGLEWSFTEDPSNAARLAVALGWFWVIRGYLSEGRQRLETILAQSLNIPPSLKAEVLYWNARMAWEQGSVQTARSLLKESLAIFRAQGSAYWTASVLLELGTVERIEEDFEAAELLYKEALEIARGLDDRPIIGWALQHLGRVAMSQGDVATARARFEEGLGILRALGDVRGMAVVLRGMASLARSRKDHAEARRLYGEALKYHREVGDRGGVALITHAIGYLARLEGDAATARALQRESLEIFHGIGSGIIVVCLAELASMAQAAGHSERAARLFGATEAMRETVGSTAPPSDRQEYGPDMVAIRAALGEEGFATAWAQGRAMTMEQAVEYALSDET